MSKLLLVPIHLDLLALDKDEQVASPKADFTQLPYRSNKNEKINATVPNLSESILSQPFEKNLTLKKGVHLHWALPDALMQGKQNEQGAIEYPAVPNRWLVTKKWTDSLKERWLIESDYLYPEGTEVPEGTAVYPIDVNSTRKPKTSTTQPFRYIGRKRIFSDDLAGSAADDYLEHLTAAGYGLPDFGAFYPNCLSVFGCHDANGMDDLQDNTLHYYEVLGWYSDLSKDPIHDTYNLIHREINEKFFWETSTLQQTQTETSPQRMMCFARVYESKDFIKTQES